MIIPVAVIMAIGLVMAAAILFYQKDLSIQVLEGVSIPSEQMALINDIVMYPGDTANISLTLMNEANIPFNVSVDYVYGLQDGNSTSPFLLSTNLPIVYELSPKSNMTRDILFTAGADSDIGLQNGTLTFTRVS